ncbi:MAG: chemotaxis protein [Chromatiales bacterium]|jgi:two-component system chemotaxis response regulator CheV
MAGNTLESNQAAGTRLELLLFRLGSEQLYGINVFKVQEIIPYRQLTQLPGAQPVVNGVATLRGVTMSVIDLSRAIGGMPPANPEDCSIIITEYNRSVHGFLVDSVDRIVHTQWEKVQPPPDAAGRDNFVTAITVIDGTMIEILDVEKVLDKIVHASTRVSDQLISQKPADNRRVLVVDDSSVARLQITRALEQINVECVTAKDGRDALRLLDDLEAQGIDLSNYFSMLISDIEMPEMDGYMLTTAIRQRPKIGDIYILLHSSISGEFNMDMVKKTAANNFIQKYHPDDLVTEVLAHFDEKIGHDNA